MLPGWSGIGERKIVHIVWAVVNGVHKNKKLWGTCVLLKWHILASHFIRLWGKIYACFFCFLFVCLFVKYCIGVSKNDFTEYLCHNWPWLFCYHDFLGRWLERPRQVLNKGFLMVKLQSSLLRSTPWFG